MQQAAEAVLLEGDFFNQKSMELSGGGKRRLSIGISFIGGELKDFEFFFNCLTVYIILDPSVVFLDEPSTGLDPSSRKDIWLVFIIFFRI